MLPVLLSTAYLPNTTWFHYFLKSDSVLLEYCEHFEKQTYRNRCEILSANGILTLTIPLEKLADKEIISAKRICYKENWQIKHWRALTSAYKNSPYFEFFEDDLKPFYFNKHELLFDYNLQLIKQVCKILRIKKEIHFTSTYSKEFNGIDCRNSLILKGNLSEEFNHYHQVFSDKYKFTPNLSVLDIVFNKGLETNSLIV